MKYIGETDLSGEEDPQDVLHVLVEDAYDALVIDLPEQYETADVDAYFERMAEDFTHHASNPISVRNPSSALRSYPHFPTAHVYTEPDSDNGPVYLHVNHTNGETTSFDYDGDKFQAIVDAKQLHDLYQSSGINARLRTLAIVDAPTRLKRMTDTDDNDPVTFGEPDDSY